MSSTSWSVKTITVGRSLHFTNEFWKIILDLELCHQWWCCRACQSQLMFYVFFTCRKFPWQRAHTLCITKPITTIYGLEKCTFRVCFLVWQILYKAMFVLSFVFTYDGTEDLGLQLRGNFKLSWLPVPVIIYKCQREPFLNWFSIFNRYNGLLKYRAGPANVHICFWRWNLAQ